MTDKKEVKVLRLWCGGRYKIPTIARKFFITESEVREIVYKELDDKNVINKKNSFIDNICYEFLKNKKMK